MQIKEVLDTLDKVAQNMFIQDYSKAQTYMAVLSKHYNKFNEDVRDVYLSYDRQLDGLAPKVDLLEDIDDV